MQRASIGASAAHFIASIAFILISGCGDSGPPLGKVSGTVSMDGNPMANVIVEFQPESGRPSKATTDAQGRYQLRHKEGVKGAIIGRHTVRILTPRPPEPEDGPAPRFKDPIPPNYNRNTELAVEVTSGSQTHDFPLKSQ